MLSTKSESVKSFHESFYGTPTPEESRRRRGKKRHHVQKEEPQNEVAVIGTHYRSFDDDSMAAFVNSATALVPWNGDAKLLIDRYDVRHLLQDLTGIRRRRARPPSPDATREELDYERYRDVEGLENASPPPEDDELKNENSPGGGYQRVGFDYSNGGDQSTRRERAEDALFSPPFFVPEHLLVKLPTSTKVHQIMAGTAKYVIEHGGQAEIVLRVKQANNPTFGFLMPDHFHHEYFRFLVNHPENVGMGSSTRDAAEEEVAVEISSEEAEGGLSLLGTAYGDADEEEDEDVEAEITVEQTQEHLTAFGEVSEAVDNVSKELPDGSSDNGSTSKRSSPTNQTSSEGVENATKDTGDSSDVPLGSGFPGNTTEEEVCELSVGGGLPLGGEAASSSGLQEPAPPGTEASRSEEAEGQGSQNPLEQLEHQVPPYKEPPIQLRRIIDKMVEFISRNGKEFEAIVRERDKNDRRFPFFLPWNEYYPYYSQAMEASLQAGEPPDGMAVVGVPVTCESQSATTGLCKGKDQVPDSFLNGVPYWDESLTKDANGEKEEAGLSDPQDFKADQSHHSGEGGMGFDAVLAAVRAATRGHSRTAEDGEAAGQLKVSDINERPEMGSDEAVMAALRAVTRRSQVDGSGVKAEIVQTGGLSDTAVSAAVGTSEDPAKIAVGIVIDEESKLVTSLPLSKTEVPSGLDGDHVVVAHVVAKAAAVAAAEEGDSAEAQLSPHEKRKAERLKRAKLFAAMIKDGNGYLINVGQGSGSVGVSLTSSLERLSQAGVALETTRLKSGDRTRGISDIVEPEGRDQTGEAPVRVTAKADKGRALDNSSKERKRKARSKEQDEKQRKHRHKRKKDAERENKSKHAPDAGEKRKDRNHDHYQEPKRKDRRHDYELEEKNKDAGRGFGSGQRKENRDFEDDGKESDNEETRKEKRHHSYELDGKRRERSRYGHDSEQRKIASRHGHASEEDMRKENRYGHVSEERMREHRDKHDMDWKRKESSYRHFPEEKRSVARYVESEEIRRERSHGKRRKHKDTVDEIDDEDGSKHDHRSKSSKEHPNGMPVVDIEKRSMQGVLKYDRKLGDGDVVKQDLPTGTGPGLKVTDAGKTARPPVDVPDDIRAKVRAMLAMM